LVDITIAEAGGDRAKAAGAYRQPACRLPRKHAQAFDHVVSVGMVEHVGYRNYRTLLYKSVGPLPQKPAD